MNSKELVKKYLDEVNIMQLATSDGNELWACNIHFYADNDLNLYWASSKERLHSLHIANNPNAAAAIKVKADTEADKTVIGISISGTATLLEANIDETIVKAFVVKHKKPENYLDNVIDGTSSSKFYMLIPSRVVLFDNKTFPDNPRVEVEL